MANVNDSKTEELVPVGLTRDELAVIERYRAKNAQLERWRSQRLELLRVAYEFEKWLQVNGAGPTYSTFCDDFGYNGENRPEVFNDVCAVRGFARQLVQGNADKEEGQDETEIGQASESDGVASARGTF